MAVRKGEYVTTYNGDSKYCHYDEYKSRYGNCMQNFSVGVRDCFTGEVQFDHSRLSKQYSPKYSSEFIDACREWNRTGNYPDVLIKNVIMSMTPDECLQYSNHTATMFRID